MSRSEGIRLAREVGDPALSDALEQMLPQLAIVLVKRLGATVTIPIAEVDATGQDILMMSVDLDKRTFTFEARKKS